VDLPSVYLETTIPSYLGAHTSTNPVYAEQQRITREWWSTAAQRFNLFVSEYVLREIRQGDADAARRRLQYVDGLPVLDGTDDVDELVDEYSVRLKLEGKGRGDVPHFAFAVAYEMDYLVTWNCRHIANGEVVRRLRDANLELGRPTPLIVTPEELLPLDEDDEP
jgi:hypothetical protein